MAEPTAQELEQIVAAVVRELLARGTGSTATTRPSTADDDRPHIGSTAWRDRPQPSEQLDPHTRNPVPQTSPLPGVPRVAHEAGLRAIQRLTPSRTGTGRAGLRYPTDIYLELRADHAFARDAVVSEPAPGFVQSLGAIELRSQASDLQTFLLQPDRGRRLDDASKQKLLAEGTRGADVQIIFADGLSAWAAEANRDLLPALVQSVTAAGFTVGKPIWVHRARIAVADEIGVDLGAKATLICLGERPGLGAGDSMSIYFAWAPRLGQDNAEKNCISNIRPAGFSAQEAAKLATSLLERARALGKGGLALGAPVRDGG